MSTLSKNKKAYFDYKIIEEFQAGIKLTGTEVKSCRKNGATLTGGFATIEDGAVYLHNVFIALYDEGNRENHEPVRKRTLLLKKSEIKHLKDEVEKKGFSLVPLSLYTSGCYIKVKLGLAKGKNFSDKRNSMKEKEFEKSVKTIL